MRFTAGEKPIDVSVEGERLVMSGRSTPPPPPLGRAQYIWYLIPALMFLGAVGISVGYLVFR